MTAYIPRWRGEAKVVAAREDMYSQKELRVVCGCLFLRAMAATRAQIWKLSRTYQEQIMNRTILRRDRTLLALYLCILSHLAPFYVVDTCS